MLPSDNASRDYIVTLPVQENGAMPLHHAVLALLAAKPAHGYELKGSF